MKFTPEEIAKQRKIYDAALTNVEIMAGADGNNLVSVFGYYEETDEYELGHYAKFANELDAAYAHEALSNYPAALAEIERLLEAHQSAALRVYEILDLLASDKPNKYKYTDQT